MSLRWRQPVLDPLGLGFLDGVQVDQRGELGPFLFDRNQQFIERDVIHLAADVPGEAHRRQLGMPVSRDLLGCGYGLKHQGIDHAPVGLRTHALLDQRAQVEVAHDALHDLQAIEGSFEIDRGRVFRYFGTESGYLLRLFARYGPAVLGAGFATTARHDR